MIIVSDTSPISNLLIIGKIDLIYQVAGRIIIPKMVEKEIKRLRYFEIDLQAFQQANWIEIKSPVNRNLIEQLNLELDQGESEAIALAKELQADFLLMDEKKGREIAKRYHIEVIGLIGILIKAKQEGIIPKLKPILEELRSKAGFWISDRFYSEVLKQVGE